MQRQEYGRSDKGGGREEIEEYESGSKISRYAGTDTGDIPSGWIILCGDKTVGNREREGAGTGLTPRADIGWLIEMAEWD